MQCSANKLPIKSVVGTIVGYVRYTHRNLYAAHVE